MKRPVKAHVRLDVAISYCPTRRAIELRSWALTSSLSDFTDRMVNTTGLNHGEFLLAQGECAKIKIELSKVRERLAEHRSLHGC